jgi:hypothetical protein
MTIAKAMQSDKAFCRRRNTWAMARWRTKHRDRYNAYQRASATLSSRFTHRLPNGFR